MEVYIRPNGSTKTRCPSIKCHRTTTPAVATAMAATKATSPAASSAETMETTGTAMNATTVETVPGNDVNAAVVVSWNPHSDSSSSPPFRSYSSTLGGKESNRLKNPALRK